MRFEQEILAADELEIDIKRIIKKWLENLKWSILCSIICGIVFVAIKYMKDIKIYNLNVANQINNANIELTEGEKLYVDRYIFLDEKKEQIVSAYEESSIHELDYNNVYCGEIQYYIEGDEQITNSVIGAIERYFNSDIFIEALKEEITFMSVESVANTSEIETYGDNRAIIVMKLYAQNEENCELYKDVINYKIKEYSDKLQNSIGKHECVILNDSITKGYSNKIYTVQNEYYEQLSKIDSQLKSISVSFSAQQIAYIDSVKEKDNSEQVVTNKPKISIKVAAVGIILGACIPLGVIIFIVLFGGKIHSERELNKRFAIHNICNFNCNDDENFKKQIFQFGKFIQLYKNSDTDTKAYIISTRDSFNQELVDALDIHFKSTNREYEMIFDVLDLKDDLNNISDASMVVLLEELDKTKVRDMYKLAELCDCTGISILGYICVEQ